MPFFVAYAESIGTHGGKTFGEALVYCLYSCHYRDKGHNAQANDGNGDNSAEPVAFYRIIRKGYYVLVLH
jgi:hypothetical protein